jgi:hypothetical protein
VRSATELQANDLSRACETTRAALDRLRCVVGPGHQPAAGRSTMIACSGQRAAVACRLSRQFPNQ